MPFKAFKRKNKVRVYKVNVQGRPIGKAFGTFDSLDDANAQVRALYARVKETTDFPNPEDDVAIELGNSLYAQFEYDYVQELRNNYPEIWAKGGGDATTAFEMWEKARSGDRSAETLDWIMEREGWVARHEGASNLAAVVAQMKWGSIGQLGVDGMKALVDKAKSRIDAQRNNVREMDELMSQAAVGYVLESAQTDERCETCRYFVAEKGGGCAHISAMPIPIVASGHCQEWKAVSEPAEETTTETVTQNPSVVREQWEFDFVPTQMPQVETYPTVDVTLLTKGDPSPMFMVLPIAQTGRVSVNELVYDEYLVSAIAEQLQGAGGGQGHVKNDELNTAFPMDVVDWIGHRRVGDTLYGKAYIPPGETRRFVERVKARGGKLGTSIFGSGVHIPLAETGKRHRLEHFELEKVDLAPAQRASLRLGGNFELVAEMQQRSLTVTLEELKEALKDTSNDDLLVVLEERFEPLAEMWGKKSKKKMVAVEMVQRVSEIEDLTRTSNRLEQDNRLLRERVAEFETREFDAGLTALVHGAVNFETNNDERAKAALNALRTTVHEHVVREMAGSKDLKAAQGKIEDYVTGPLKPVMEMTVAGLAGPSAVVAEQSQKSPREKANEEAVEGAKGLREAWGI